MTNREKWARKVAVTDELIEDVICKTYATYGFGDSKQDCPECPIEALCTRLVLDGGLTESAYMEAVSEWLDEEVEETGNTADTIFEKENALKLIDCLETTNDTLRREIVMSDAIMYIGKET